MPHSSLTTTITLLLLLLLLLLFISSTTSSSNLDLTTRRNLALMDQDHDPPLKKLKPTLKPKNQTKLITPNSTTTVTTKKPNKLSKTLNATKPIKPKKLNSTTTTTTPLLKTKLNKTLISKPLTSTSKPNPKPLQQQNNHQTPTWLDDGSSTDDLIADFRDIPSHLLPDLERISTTSKAYISLANIKLTKTVKPYVGTKHAANVATAASAAFLFLPLLLLAVAFRKLKTFLSLHGLLLFIQAYLAIYFATLAASALATGLEPLLYLHAASPPAYALVQALQTLGYVMYLVVQVVHLVVLFNDDGGGGGDGGAARRLGLAQIIVGLAVGVHYYAAVFHWAVAGEALRAGWRVHAAYSACFVVICACGRAEQRKKAYYVAEGGDDGKKS